MFGRLLPRKVSFFDYFEKHAALIMKASQELVVLLSPGVDIIAQANRIQNLEHEADTIAHQCVEELHKTFITPIERNDIYRLISRMDDIIDFIEETAKRIVIYKLNVMTPGVNELASILMKSVKEMEFIIGGLRKMDGIEIMRAKFIAIKQTENESDAVLLRLIGQLFEEEKDTLTIIKWKEIYENLESAVDRCEDVSNIVEGVILEQS